jgi:hypothetical protein
MLCITHAAPGQGGCLFTHAAISVIKLADSSPSSTPRPTHSLPFAPQVEIQTGRPHQVRIHMACLGHPLLGDPLYAAGGVPKKLEQQATGGVSGSAAAVMPGDCGYLLHSMELSCVHPAAGGEVLSIRAPPPAELTVPGERW